MPKPRAKKAGIRRITVADEMDTHQTEPICLSPADSFSHRQRSLQLVGTGPNGSVHMLQDEHLCVHAVVKIVRLGKDGRSAEHSQISKDIRDEIARIQSSDENLAGCIVPVVGALSLGPYMWMVSPYCSGGSLASYLDPQRPILGDHAQIILYRIGCALSWIHSLGLIHGNLKSSNVLLTEHGAVRLCDFGLTEIAYGGQSYKQRMRIGSLQWAAPELFHDGIPFDNRIDVWSYGAVAHEIMIGMPPNRFTHDMMPPYYQGCYGSPPSDMPDLLLLKDFVGKCLTLEPDQRPTIEDVMAHAYLDNAGQDDPTEIIKEFIQRRREMRDETINRQQAASDLEESLNHPLSNASELPTMPAFTSTEQISRCSSPFGLDRLITPPTTAEGTKETGFYANRERLPLMHKDQGHISKNSSGDQEDINSCPPSPTPLLSRSSAFCTPPFMLECDWSTTEDSSIQDPEEPIHDIFYHQTQQADTSGTNLDSACLSDAPPEVDALDDEEIEDGQQHPLLGKEYLDAAVSAFKRLNNSKAPPQHGDHRKFSSESETPTAEIFCSQANPQASPKRSPATADKPPRLPSIIIPGKLSLEGLSMRPKSPPTPAKEPLSVIPHSFDEHGMFFDPFVSEQREETLPPLLPHEKPLPPLPVRERMIPRSAGRRPPPRRQSHPRRKSSLSLFPQPLPPPKLALARTAVIGGRRPSAPTLRGKEMESPPQHSFFEIDEEEGPAAAKLTVKNELKRLFSTMSGHIGGSLKVSEGFPLRKRFRWAKHGS